MVVKAKHKAPSKVRYDKEHPVVSIRLTSKLKDALDGLGEFSYSDILLAGLKKLKPRVDKAYSEGYSDAEAEYAVEYPCAVCGKPIKVTSPEAKRVCRSAMVEAGWAHKSCIDRSR